MKNKNKYIVGGSLSLMLASMTVLLWLPTRSHHDTETPTTDGQQTSQQNAPSAQTLGPVYTEGPLSKLPTDEQKLAQFIKSRYGKHLDHPSARIEAFEQMKKFLMSKYPYDWEKRLKELLKVMFPEDYEKLLTAFAAFTSYNDWQGQLGTMVFNSKEERQRAIWDKRIQLFGDDAKIIWQSQLRQEQVDAALQKIDTSSLPLSAKVDNYVQTLVNVYGEQAKNPEKSHPVQVMGNFLQLKSVQDQLHTLTPEQQKQELTHLRSAIGLDQAALTRWDELDAKRAERATAGTNYMKERANLAKQYQGENLELQIQNLQNRLFGEEEAVFIRNEEKAGNFRYKERQIIGVN